MKKVSNDTIRIQYSVIQFFLKGLLFTPLKSKVYILSIYLYIYIYKYIYNII